jgi:3'-phosphoadenosine 5'-phosphosulfate sulfotransferase (PAPS reductase)/FAD synthetase
MKITAQELKIRLSWPLDMKIEWFCKVYSEFIIKTKGQCYQSFSGGKDSNVGTDIIDRIHDGTFKHITPQWDRVVSYGKPPKVFSNTGLEFPEIVDHVKKFDNVTVVKPRIGFTRVIKEYGFAVGSKKIAMMISRLRGYIANPKLTNNATMNLYLHGIKKDGSKGHSSSQLPIRWKKLLDAPFLISDKCCDILKKEPFHRYEIETNRKPIVFTTTSEGDQRAISYLLTGCNSFEEGKERSRPFSIFTEADVWEYAYRWKIRFAEVYYERTVQVEQVDGSIVETTLEGEERTGCMWCQFGIHLEDKSKNNRIQRIAISHPKLHHMIINKVGLGEVLTFIGIPFTPKKCGKQTQLF